jgi:hypothetical protein
MRWSVRRYDGQPWNCFGTACAAAKVAVRAGFSSRERRAAAASAVGKTKERREDPRKEGGQVGPWQFGPGEREVGQRWAPARLDKEKVDRAVLG